MSDPEGSPRPTRSPRSYEATEQFVHVAFALALVCMGAIAIVAHRTVVELREQTKWVEHTHEVLNRLDALHGDLLNAQNRVRGYTLLGDPTFLEGFADSARRLVQEVDRVGGLTRDDREQQQRVQKVGQVIEAYLGFSRRVIEARRDRGFDAARALLLTREGETFHNNVRQEIEAMRAKEADLLRERRARAERGATLTDAAIIGGSILGVILVGVASAVIRRDLTGRRRAESELRQSQQNLETTLGSIGDAVIATDADGRVTRLNPRASELCGFTADEARGQPLSRILCVVDEKSKTALPLPSQQDVAEGTARLPAAAAILARNGSLRSVAEHVTPIRQPDGTVSGCVWVLRDVTEERAANAHRLQAEQELERFFNLSVDFLAISSGDGYFKRVSPGVTAILGWTPEEFIARPYLDFVHPDDVEITKAEVARQLERGEKVMRFRNRYRHKDGTWRTISWRSTPVPGGLMYGVGRDVTELIPAVLPATGGGAQL